MGPLIDAKLEKVDRKHAQLTQLSSDLVEALNLYHSLMREPTGPGPSFIQKPGNYGYMPIPNPPPVHQPQVIYMILTESLIFTTVKFKKKFFLLSFSLTETLLPINLTYPQIIRSFPEIFHSRFQTDRRHHHHK